MTKLAVYTHFLLLTIKKRILNFTFELKRSPDGNWGSIQPDGTWNGMIRELQTKRADIGKKMVLFLKTQFVIHLV